MFNRLIMSRTGTPKGPLFLANGNSDGAGDGVMVAKDVEALAHTYCQRGVSVQFHEYKGLDHGQSFATFSAGALAFLTAPPRPARRRRLQFDRPRELARPIKL